MNQELGPLHIDNGTKHKLPRHHYPSSTDDELETPDTLYYKLIKQKNVFPRLDPFATASNSKCTWWFTKEQDAFDQDWVLPDGTECDIWVNHPHTLHEETISKIHEEYKKHNVNIIMIIPANTQRTTYWHRYIEPHRFQRYHRIGHIDVDPIKGSITFLKNGKKTSDSSRNAYLSVVWRKSRHGR